MKQITEITNDAIQQLTITTDAQDEFDLLLYYSDIQECWFFDLTFGDFELKGQRIVNHPNLLRSFKNILPFGLSVATNDGGEILFIDDFTTSRAFLYILEKDEVIATENEFFK